MNGPQRYTGERLPWPQARIVAAALWKARLDAKRRQYEVAAALEWSPGRLHLKERGSSRMRQDEALALAGELGVDPQELGLEAAGMTAANDERGGQ